MDAHYFVNHLITFWTRLVFRQLSLTADCHWLPYRFCSSMPVLSSDASRGDNFAFSNQSPFMFQPSFQVATKAFLAKDHIPAVLHDKLSSLLWSSKHETSRRRTQYSGWTLSSAWNSRVFPSGEPDRDTATPQPKTVSVSLVQRGYDPSFRGVSVLPLSSIFFP